MCLTLRLLVASRVFRLTSEQLKAYKIPTFQVDYTDEESILRLAEDYAGHPRGGSLDVLVNCAGLMPILTRHLNPITV
jgi:NAD(P)-dependent dehydrogenase (short-subunit alcohol dehydrogenase family)